MCNGKEIFTAVYDELFNNVYAYFNICFGVNSAEDLTQEIFLKVWKAIETGKIPEDWRAWVFRCAVNLKNDSLRKKYLTPETAEIDENAKALSEQDIDGFYVKDVFGKLAQDEKELLSLKVSGFNSNEIGELLGISASAVRTRLQKAKQSFSDKLQDKEKNNE